MSDWTKEPYNEDATLYDVWYKNALVAFTGTEQEADEFIASKQ
jgi:hypothetical protein